MERREAVDVSPISATVFVSCELIHYETGILHTGLVLRESSVGVCLAGERLLVAVGGGGAGADGAGFTGGVRGGHFVYFSFCELNRDNFVENWCV